jgi:hypothetical protein
MIKLKSLICETDEYNAAELARKLGLIYREFGRWAYPDDPHTIVAKTVKGILVRVDDPGYDSSNEDEYNPDTDEPVYPEPPMETEEDNIPWKATAKKIKEPSFQLMLDRGAWDITEVDVDERYDGTRRELAINPKIVDGVKVHKSPHRRRPEFYDETLAYIDEDERIKPKPDSGYSREIPAEKEDGFIYRGMSAEEWETAQSNGFVKSRGDYNIGSGQDGLTYYAEDPRTAASYATSYQPYPMIPTFERPAMVIKIKRPADAVIDQAPEGEVGVRQKISVDDIVEKYIAKPYHMSQGSIDILDGWDGARTGSRGSPSSDVVWKKLNDGPQLSESHRRIWKKLLSNTKI